ncbi:glutamate--tRNA ligase [Candidatus Methanoplasma termitum]|uniref:Glutamate--tRNA ligase n=1 Tax=Candidatus Methanoplasma termitum TaxID=1577791 RepID=A0A0A7LE83_9ARCH|nr:glutamate--tRNA ligase [Candidatus Methanoplasma termitum]AIZ56582.1 glutamate--tRNA ligase [Candidatus Methanoplasma termitum]MCL2333829.1 glutamate--tRNA ligase [Candidatus Methanoplasma sp.]
MSDDRTEALIRKYALQNAVFFKGTANSKAVVGKVLSENPELRSKAGELTPLIESITADVNKMSLEEQTKMLSDIDPSLMVKEKKERIYLLPELRNAVDGKVVMRIAPGPSGPLHIGHTRVSILNDEYVKRYNGKLIIRYEDTNPEKIDPDAYRMISEDLDWLGVKIHESITQSDRFEIYYEITRELIDKGHAYVCTCKGDDWREMKEDEKECPCRSLPINVQLERYDKLLNGEYGEGDAVAVVKTELDHPNPAIRDFVALRVVDHPHPKTGDRYRAYPMMNLSVAIDDHLLGVTHVIRGKDHLNNTLRQEYIFNYFGWKKPEYYHYGLVNIPDAVLKTSLIKESIRSGEYSGWDDVRTGTVRAIERRGIRPEAVRRYWVESGIKSVDIQFSWDNLYGMNRDIIDDISNRYFFVADPVKYNIEGVETIDGHAPLHPDHPERGSRNYRLSGKKTVSISSEDSKVFAEHKLIRLKDLCNLEYGTPAKFAGNDLSLLKKGAKAVQWVGKNGIKTELYMPDGSIIHGMAEDAILKESKDTVQFERVGFVRIEAKKDNGIRAIFTHR